MAKSKPICELKWKCASILAAHFLGRRPPPGPSIGKCRKCRKEMCEKCHYRYGECWPCRQAPKLSLGFH